MIRDACTRTRFSVVTLTRSTGTSTLSLHDALPILLREMARAYLRLIGEAGLTGALFPETYGGNGRGVVAECIVDEELAAAGHPADTIRSVSLTLGTISILRYGTEAQKKRHIPPRLVGEELAALAITEPQIGSDTSRMQTRAVLKGDRGVIPGQ